MTSCELVTPPVSEPVTLAEMKTHARIDTATDDALVAGLITAARQWAERYTGRAFITQTWRLWLDDVPANGQDLAQYVELPRAPLLAVNKVEVFDDNDAATVWPVSHYFVDTAREPGRLALRFGAVWPRPARPVNGIKIECDAGYGSGGSDVPEPIKLAIKQLVAHWYEHRGEAVIASSSRSNSSVSMGGANVPLVIQALLDSYRIQCLGA